MNDISKDHKYCGLLMKKKTDDLIIIAMNHKSCSIHHYNVAEWSATVLNIPFKQNTRPI